MDALINAATRTSTDEFRRLVAWFKRAARSGSIPPGVAIADILDLQIRAMRLGRCAVPYCSYRAAKAKPPSLGRGRPPGVDPENRHRLCRIHRRLRRQGFLVVEGTPETPRFFDCDGREIRYRE